MISKDMRYKEKKQLSSKFIERNNAKSNRTI